MESAVPPFRIHYFRQGRPIGDMAIDGSLDDALKTARAELVERGADFFFIVDVAGGAGDVWAEGLPAANRDPTPIG
jgi:hypothetical protein